MGIGKPGKAAQVHPQGQIAAFDMAGGDMTDIGIAGTDVREHSDHVTVVAVPFGTSVARFRENLSDLREVNIGSVELFDRSDIAFERIGRKLESATGPAAQIAHELKSVDRIPSADVERKNHLRVAVQSEPGVGISPFGGRVGIQAPCMATDKTPDFVSLHMPGPNAAHRAIEDSPAMLASIDHEGHDRVFVQIGETGDRPDAHSFQHQAESLGSAVNVGVVPAERLGGSVGKGSFARVTAVALDLALAVGAKLVRGIVFAADAGHVALPLNWGEESGTIGLGLECGLPRVLDLAPPPVSAGDGALLSNQLGRRFNGDYYRLTGHSERDLNYHSHRGFVLSETAQASDTRLGGSYLKPKSFGNYSNCPSTGSGARNPVRFGLFPTFAWACYPFSPSTGSGHRMGLSLFFQSPQGVVNDSENARIVPRIKSFLNQRISNIRDAQRRVAQDVADRVRNSYLGSDKGNVRFRQQPSRMIAFITKSRQTFGSASQCSNAGIERVPLHCQFG